MPQININTDAFVVLAHKLEQLNRSALPVAVRQALNDAAFDVKQRSLQASASNNFIRRSPGFFKTFSGVNKAEGFNINSMKAEVGMTDRGNVSARTAVKHMDVQEQGGSVSGGGDYLRGARAGGLKRRVSQASYYKNIKNNLVTGPAKKRTAKSAFVAAAYVSLMQNKAMVIDSPKGKFIISVTSINSSVKSKRTWVKTKVLMMDRKNAPIRATHFSREAAEVTVSRIPAFWLKQAQKQFERALK